MSRVVVVGEVMVDVVARLAGALAPGSDAPARIALHGGGSGANVAAWLAHAGTAADLVSCVGNDDRGREACGALRAGGVKTHFAVDPELPTGTCVVLVAPGGERTMVPDPGSNVALAAGDVPDEVLDAASHLHVSGYTLLREGSRRAGRAAIERASQRDVPVSVDPSSAALLSHDFFALARGAELLLPNLDEAEALTGDRDPEAAARALAERFPEVALKLGAQGALWSDGDELLRVEAPAAETVDSTGAGDAFAAGLLAARLAGEGPEAALEAGCRLAAAAVRIEGGRPGPREPQAPEQQAPDS